MTNAELIAATLDTQTTAQALHSAALNVAKLPAGFEARTMFQRSAREHVRKLKELAQTIEDGLT